FVVDVGEGGHGAPELAVVEIAVREFGFGDLTAQGFRHDHVGQALEFGHFGDVRKVGNGGFFDRGGVVAHGVPRLWFGNQFFRGGRGSMASPISTSLWLSPVVSIGDASMPRASISSTMRCSETAIDSRSCFGNCRSLSA